MASKPLRLVFAGTPEFSAAHLRALVDSDHELVGVYTQPDRPSGRGKKLAASPVKQVALEFDLPVFQPQSLKNEAAAAELDALRCDAMIVVAYGLILPQAILDIPRLACLNVHASLLPRWRGAAPIQRAIEAGDRVTGLCIMQMDAGLDTGAVLARRETPISHDCTAGALHDQLLTVGPALLLEVLQDLPSHLEGATPQEESGATYAHKIEKAEAELDWTLGAAELQRKVMAFNPFPVAWTTLQSQRLKIHRTHICPDQGRPGQILSADSGGICVACGEGALCIERLQLPGGKALASADVLNSRRELFTPGTLLGS